VTASPASLIPARPPQRPESLLTGNPRDSRHVADSSRSLTPDPCASTPATAGGHRSTERAPADGVGGTAPRRGWTPRRAVAPPRQRPRTSWNWRAGGQPPARQSHGCGPQGRHRHGVGCRRELPVSASGAEPWPPPTTGWRRPAKIDRRRRRPSHGDRPGTTAGLRWPIVRRSAARVRHRTGCCRARRTPAPGVDRRRGRRPNLIAAL